MLDLGPWITKNVRMFIFYFSRLNINICNYVIGEKCFPLFVQWTYVMGENTL